MPTIDATMEIARKKVADLCEAPYNPRHISDGALEALKHSLERFGMVQPIIWNKVTGNVVGGHQRLKLLRTFGVEETDVVVKDLDETEEKALNLMLNNDAAQGSFTAAADAILEEIRESMPEVYDELLLFRISAEVDEDIEEAMRTTKPRGAEPGQYDLSPEPYESYNYAVLLFKNTMDWTAAIDHFQLKPARKAHRSRTGTHKVGLGRVIDGKDYIDRITAALKGRKI